MTSLPRTSLGPCGPRRTTDGDGTVRVAGALALATFFVLLTSGWSGDLLGSPVRMALVLGWLLAAALFWGIGRPSLVIVYLIGAGLLLRWDHMPATGQGGSDVLTAVNEALGVWLDGGNPYAHYYTQTRPPGQPMPYPPGALLVHLPGHLIGGLAGVQWTQFAFAGATMGIFALLATRSSWLAALAGLALYAGAPNLVVLTADGSNDTVTGTLLLLAVLAVAWAFERGADDRSLVLAGMVAGLAISTKQLALPIALALSAYAVRSLGWRRASRYLAGAIGLLLLVSLPLLVMGPLTFARGLVSFVGVHEEIMGWNIWSMLQGFGVTPWDRDSALTLSVVVSGAALYALVAWPARSLAGAALAGVIATLVILFAARWTTYAYFALCTPVLLAIPAILAWEAKHMEQGLDPVRTRSSNRPS